MPDSIFKSTDIRGRYPSALNEENIRILARAVGIMSHGGTVVLGGDTRKSTPALMESCRKGLIEAGSQVVELGVVTTPWLHFGWKHLGASAGLMVTASHNPPEENGVKICLESHPFTPEKMEQLRRIFESGAPASSSEGTCKSLDLTHAYKNFLCKSFQIRGGLKVVLDAGGGATGRIAPLTFRSLGFEVVELACEPGLERSGRPPDPTLPGALENLCGRIRESHADLGFAFDGDGDRVVVVDEKGNVLSSDITLGLMARRVLSKHPNRSVVCDVKMSELVGDVVRDAGGQRVRCPTGQSHVMLALAREKAVLAGEYSGHFILPELGPFDDGILASLYLSFLVQEGKRPLSSLSREFPHYATTPEVRVSLRGNPQESLSRLRQALPAEARVETLDGIRAVFPTGWGLARASGTENVLTLRFEAKRSQDLKELVRKFLTGLPEIYDEVMQVVGLVPARAV